ncbi:COX15/CtaA family protein [Pseudoclavibacter albus]|uniref:COX15/CtaA family protein n=1 Tax=Pseudoclavibacter albus TaxID=272241 RepID=UPI0009FB48DE|nr:COX15/CtaA family protein [Pseudoclavibacter alba]
MNTVQDSLSLPSSKLMPNHVTAWTRFCAWATLVVQIGIIGTGGLVRVTGSGLGCPTWPKCTDESLVATPEMGIHGIIEFGNRTLTGVLCVVALFTFLAVLRTKGSGLRLLSPAVWIGVLIIVQAVVGGLSVWASLDPRIVGVHFVFSAVIVALSAVLLYRVLRNEPAGHEPGNRVVRLATMITVVMGWITLLVGVLTTGSGPHAGDSKAARNGLDTEIMHHVHSYPAYILLLVTLILLWLAVRQRMAKLSRVTTWFLVTLLAQMGIGIAQSRLGLPAGMVVLHMLISGIAIALLTIMVLESLRTVDEPHFGGEEDLVDHAALRTDHAASA